MLKITKKMAFTGEWTLDGTMVAVFNATIDSSNPENITVTSAQANKPLYKDNRVDIRKSYAEFEDMVYSEADKLLAEATEKASTTQTTEGVTTDEVKK